MWTERVDRACGLSVWTELQLFVGIKKACWQTRAHSRSIPPELLGPLRKVAQETSQFAYINCSFVALSPP